MDKIKHIAICFYPVLFIFFAMQFVDIIFNPTGKSPLILLVLKWGIIVICAVAGVIKYVRLSHEKQHESDTIREAKKQEK